MDGIAKSTTVMGVVIVVIGGAVIVKGGVSVWCQ